MPAKLVYNVNSSIDPMNFPDIGMIPHTNEAAALDFLRQRYVKGQIYVCYAYRWEVIFSSLAQHNLQAICLDLPPLLVFVADGSEATVGSHKSF